MRRQHPDHRMDIPISMQVYHQLITASNNTGFEKEDWEIAAEAIDEWVRRHDPDALPAPAASGYQWKRLFLPDGTVLRTVFGGKNYHCLVQGDSITYDGKAVSPSGFVNAVGGMRRNAWLCTWILFPDTKEWKLADTLRTRACPRRARKPAAGAPQEAATQSSTVPPVAATQCAAVQPVAATQFAAVSQEAAAKRAAVPRVTATQFAAAPREAATTPAAVPQPVDSASSVNGRTPAQAESRAARAWESPHFQQAIHEQVPRTRPGMDRDRRRASMTLSPRRSACRTDRRNNGHERIAALLRQ